MGMSSVDAVHLRTLLLWMFTDAGLRRLVDEMTEDGDPDSWDLPGEMATRTDLGHAVIVGFERRRRLDELRARLGKMPGWEAVVERVFAGGAVEPLPEPRPAPVGDGGVRPLRPNPFPRPPAMVFGRDADVGSLDTLVEAGDRLISLVGPPGIGRTTLAMAWANQRWLSARGAPGWYARLAAASGPPGFAAAVADAMGLALASAADAEAAVDLIGEALAERGDALLVLDHMDQRVRDCAPAVQRWMQEAPGLRVLVTSVEPLALPGRVFEVSPLAPEAGVALFLDRARQAGAALDDDAPTHQAILEIVRRLDGMPHAIELMASCAPGLSVPELVEAGAMCLDVLASAGQPALELALNASFEQLDATQREAIATLSVFEGGFFGPEAAAILPGLPVLGGAPMVLQGLKRRSLLITADIAQLGGIKRWRMHEVVRQLARRRLVEAGREADVLTRQRGALIAAAAQRQEALAVEGWERASAWLRLELDNLVSALRGASPGSDDQLRLALAIDGAMSLRGPLGDLLGFLDLALSQAEGAPELRAAVLVARAEVRRSLGRNLDLALADVEAAAALATEPERRGVLHRVHASLLRLTGRPEEAEAAISAALAVVGLGPRGRGQALGELASVLHARGRLPSAEIACREAVAALREARDTRGVAVNIGNLGILVYARGEADEARRCHQEALELFHRVGLLSQEGLQHNSLGNLALQQGQLDDALHHYEQAQLAFVESGLTRPLATTLGNLALTRFDQGQTELALSMLEDAVARLGRHELRRQQALMSTNLAVCQWRARGDASGLPAAVSLAEQAGDHRLLAYALSWRAAARPVAEAEQARAEAGRARTLAEEGGDLGISSCVALLGDLVALRLGDLGRDAAAAHLAAARAGEDAPTHRWRSARDAASALAAILALQGT